MKKMLEIIDIMDESIIKLKSLLPTNETILTDKEDIRKSLIISLIDFSLTNSEIDKIVNKTIEYIIKYSEERDILIDSKKKITIERIYDYICKKQNIKKEDAESKSRKRDTVMARQLAMYFAKIYTKESFEIISSKIGKRDHTTALHAIKVINNLKETDKIVNKLINDYKEYFENNYIL